MLSPFRMVCCDFILPEICKPCLFLSSLQFATLIVPSLEEPEELFSSPQGSSRHRLEFRTPACFKSRKEYRILPTTRLVLQSLIQQWNVCFPDCLIEDENGEGTEAMADGLLCRHLQLHDEPYVIKKGEVTGFVGSIVLDNRLDGFHRQLADALLEFSSFAGIGIKTSLGMGGVLHRRIP